MSSSTISSCRRRCSRSRHRVRSASTSARRVTVAPAGRSDINDLMVALASAGRRVVRLKAGDALMFGRLDEEITALVAAGIAFDVVPGISAAQGAAAALGISLTRRRGARRFQAITGHAADGCLPDDFDWSGLADPKATTAVYMPKATIDGPVRRAFATRPLGAAPGRRRIQCYASGPARRDRLRRNLAGTRGGRRQRRSLHHPHRHRCCQCRLRRALGGARMRQRMTSCVCSDWSRVP